MRTTLVILLLLAAPLWAVDSVSFRAHYPASDAVSVPGDTTVWWYVPSYPDLVLGDLTVMALGVVAVDSGDIDSAHWSFALSHDTLFLSRADRSIDFYQEVEILVSVYRGQSVKVGEDSFSFRTESGTTPFAVTCTEGYWLTGAGATGTAALRIARPYGTTVYGFAPDGAEFLIYAPSTTYATERLTRLLSYSLSGITPGFNRFYFFGMTPESLYTDTVGIALHYEQVENGVPRGTIGR